MREDWLGLTQLKVLTGLLTEPEPEPLFLQPVDIVPPRRAAPVEWTAPLPGPPDWLLTVLCFLISALHWAGRGGGREGLVVSIVISFWRT